MTELEIVDDEVNLPRRDATGKVHGTTKKQTHPMHAVPRMRPRWEQQWLPKIA